MIIDTEAEEAQARKLEEEIESMQKTIDRWEDIDPMYARDERRELRHQVMFVHARLETSLAILLGKYILEPLDDTVPTETKQLMMRRFHKVAGSMEFAQKVNLAQELNLISGHMKSKLFAVNDLRKIFSHPASYEEKMQSFLEPENYKKALKTLIEAYDSMNEIFR